MQLNRIRPGVTPHSSKLGDKIRTKCFVRTPRDAKVYYVPRPEYAEEIKALRRYHGVCPACNLWALTVGRCVQCGWESA